RKKTQSRNKLAATRRDSSRSLVFESRLSCSEVLRKVVTLSSIPHRPAAFYSRSSRLFATRLAMASPLEARKLRECWPLGRTVPSRRERGQTKVQTGQDIARCLFGETHVRSDSRRPSHGSKLPRRSPGHRSRSTCYPGTIQDSSVLPTLTSAIPTIFGFACHTTSAWSGLLRELRCSGHPAITED